MMNEVTPSNTSKIKFWCRQCGKGKECELTINLDCQGGCVPFYPQGVCAISSAMNHQVCWEKVD